MSPRSGAILWIAKTNRSLRERITRSVMTTIYFFLPALPPGIAGGNRFTSFS